MYKCAVALAFDRAVAVWSLDGSQSITTRNIEAGGTANRQNVLAVLTLLRVHAETSTVRDVEIHSVCNHTRWGCNLMATWNPQSLNGGGSLQRNNDLWLVIKELCSGVSGLRLRCIQLPELDTLTSTLRRIVRF